MLVFVVDFRSFHRFRYWSAQWPMDISDEKIRIQYKTMCPEGYIPDFNTPIPSTFYTHIKNKHTYILNIFIWRRVVHKFTTR